MKMFYTFLVLALIMLLSFKSFAQQPNDLIYQTIPEEYDSIAGDATFLGPLYSGERTYQLLIREDLLTNFVGKEIESLSWRLPVEITSNWPSSEATVTNYDLWLSGSVNPADMSTTDFSSNVVGTQRHVKSGSLIIPTNSYPGGGDPNDWGPEITFDSLYLYTGGNLLIELSLTGITGTTDQSVDAVFFTDPSFGTLFSACWGDGYNANSGFMGNFAIIHLKAEDVVPVELTSFTAASSENRIELNWITGTETNNKGFEIERSRRLKIEDQIRWEKIGYVGGYGTTTEKHSYSYIDENLSDGTYSYRLKQIDFDGTYNYSNIVEVNLNQRVEFSLRQNYPNPFNPTTKIEYTIPQDGVVKIKVFNLLGQEVASLVNGLQTQGTHDVTFDADKISSGIYYYRLEAGNNVMVKKMMLIK
jgi:Secretion system C-terminal sorting domain